MKTDIKSIKRSVAAICALFMCTACGQAEPPAATAPAETTTTTAEVTTEAQKEEVTEAETTAVETEETTMLVTIETTGKVENAEAKAPETETTTEAETEAKAVDRSSLPSEAMLDVQRNGKGNSSVIASVLVYYGIDCTSADITGADDVASKDIDGMISVINSFIDSKGGGYEAIDMSGYTMTDISAEIVNGNPVLYWTNKEFGAIYGYSYDSIDSSGYNDSYYYISSLGRKGDKTGGSFYEDDALPTGCLAVVIHKK